MLLFSIVSFLIGNGIFTETQLVVTPVRVSELGILLSIVAIGFLLYSIYLFKKSIVKI